MPWNYIYIEKQSDAIVFQDKVKKALFAAMAITNDRDIAFFSKINAHTEGTHFYFAPGIETIASGLGCSEVGKPTKEQVGSLLFGDQTVIKRLFG